MSTHAASPGDGSAQSGRRGQRVVIVSLVGVILALLAGCGATQPEPTVAPYVDVTAERPDLVAATQAAGAEQVVLSFVLASDGRCTPAWGGVLPLDDPELNAETIALRDHGVEPVVASGGAHGEYLEQACGSSGALAGAYGAALDAVGARNLDVDVEADVDAGRVIAALDQLHSERDIDVALTLRVSGPEVGLEPAAIDLVRRAVAADVPVTVNPMVMNFAYEGGWADAMTRSVDSVARQLAEIRPGWTPADPALGLGLTVMIGRTDVGDVTSLDDAAAVRDFARERGLTRLGMWSLARDNGSCPDEAVAVAHCSGISQSDYEFTNVLNGSGR